MPNPLYRQWLRENPDEPRAFNPYPERIPCGCRQFESRANNPQKCVCNHANRLHLEA